MESDRGDSRRGGGSHLNSSPEPGHAEVLVPILYGELRAIARRLMDRERTSHTLQPTAIVNEAFVRLAARHNMAVKGRLHFIRLCSAEMRRILVEHARQKQAVKRGCGAKHVRLHSITVPGQQSPVDIVALDEALSILAQSDPQKVQIVEMRFFAGLSHPEIAEVLGISLRTVERKWSVARSRLYSILHGDSAHKELNDQNTNAKKRRGK